MPFIRFELILVQHLKLSPLPIGLVWWQAYVESNYVRVVQSHLHYHYAISLYVTVPFIRFELILVQHLKPLPLPIGLEGLMASRRELASRLPKSKFGVLLIERAAWCAFWIRTQTFTEFKTDASTVLGQRCIFLFGTLGRSRTDGVSLTVMDFKSIVFQPTSPLAHIWWGISDSNRETFDSKSNRYTNSLQYPKHGRNAQIRTGDKGL